MKHLIMLARVVILSAVVAAPLTIQDLKNKLAKFRPVHKLLMMPPNDSDQWSKLVSVPKYWTCNWETPGNQNPVILVNETEEVTPIPGSKDDQSLGNNVDSLRFRSGTPVKEKISVWLFPPNYMGLEASDDVYLADGS